MTQMSPIVNGYFRTRMAFHEGRTRVWQAICEYLQAEVGSESSVAELGAGYCNFINQIHARAKFAVDRDPTVAEHCADGIQFVHADVTDLPLAANSVDVVFASNLLEHLHDHELEALFRRLDSVLRPEGKLLLLQPNYHYCYRTYWDDYTHVKAFSHVSLCDFLRSRRYAVTRCIPRFLPFSFHSVFPKSYILTKLYLILPLRPFGSQMLVVARRDVRHDVQG